MQIHIGKTKVIIEKGDISEQNVDAIAIASNDRLWMGGGVADAIKRKGGEDIESEAMKQGPAKNGEIVITGAGELSAKHILHTVIMGQDLKPTEESIKIGTRNLLNKADELGLKSIAMPAFGTGVGKFPARQAAQSMVEQIIDVLLESKNLQEVRVILHNEGIYNTFIEEFKRRFSK